MDNKYIAITRKYEETFAETMNMLSKEKEEDVVAIGIVVLTTDGYYTYYGNANSLDKHAMASVMQTEATRDDSESDLAEAVCGVFQEQGSAIILEGIKAVLDVMGIDYDDEDLAEAGNRLKGLMEGQTEDDESDTEDK